MGVQVNTEASKYMIYDARGFSGHDSIYLTAVEMTNQVMDGLDRLEHAVTIETSILFITTRRAYLVLQAVSDDRDLINPAFGSTLKSITYDPETGYIQKYVIPILDY
jgi:hypothetical protein